MSDVVCCPLNESNDPSLQGTENTVSCDCHVTQTPPIVLQTLRVDFGKYYVYINTRGQSHLYLVVNAPVCVCGCVCGCVFVCVGVWVCGCVGVCGCGCVGVWVCGCGCGCGCGWVCGCGCVVCVCGWVCLPVRSSTKKTSP